MPSVEERLAVVETQQVTGIDLLKEIRNDVKDIASTCKTQDLRIASLEQSRTVNRRLAGLIGVPVIGAVVVSFLKTLGIY